MKPLLTKRERQVLALIAQGHTDKEAGIMLSISTATVSTHLKNSYRKLNANNRVEAVYKMQLQNSMAMM